MSDSFVYCWHDDQRDMRYIGVHKGSQDDGYICSSKLMLQEYKARPQDFTREIIAEGNWKDMIELETTMLKKVDAGKNPKYYNRHTNNGKFVNLECTKETAAKISASNLGKPKLKARGPRPHFAGENNSFFGKTHTEENRKKLSELKKKQYLGGGNPRAKAIIIDSIEYETMKMAAEELQTSVHFIRKMLKEGVARRSDI